MGRTPAGPALTSLVLEVFRLNGRLLMAGDRLTRPVGQTSARWQVLGSLDHDAQTVPQIARGMGLTRQSVQRTVDRLHVEGLVTSLDNPAHQRAKLVSLTPRGRSVLEWISERQTTWSNQIGGRLGATALERAAQVLRSFREALESEQSAAVPGPGRPRSPKKRRRSGPTRSPRSKS